MLPQDVLDYISAEVYAAPEPASAITRSEAPYAGPVLRNPHVSALVGRDVTAGELSREAGTSLGRR